VVDPLKEMGIGEEAIERAEPAAEETETKAQRKAREARERAKVPELEAAKPESLEELEDLDVVAAVKNETLAAFEHRLMAATIQGVDAIEVEPRLIKYIMRTHQMPEGDCITYRGIKLVAEGKLEEMRTREARTVNDVLFPRGYGNAAPLPADVK